MVAVVRDGPKQLDQLFPDLKSKLPLVGLSNLSLFQKLFQLLHHRINALLRIFTLSHFRSQQLLGESSRLPIGFAQTVLRRKCLDLICVVEAENCTGVLFEPRSSLHYFNSLVLALFGHVPEELVDFAHLRAVPLNFVLAVVASVLKERVGLQHLLILGDEGRRAHLPQVHHCVMERLALFRKLSCGVFLPPRHALKLSQIFASGKLIFDPVVLPAELSKLELY